MAANVENMFYVRETPWHGLGTKVENAPTSKDAIIMAGLNWKVLQEPVYTENGERVEGFRANIRDFDRKVLGVVSERYRVIQNQEAFAFTDVLLGEGVQYETAGSLQEGKRVWMLAQMPEKYIVAGDEMESYMVFSNTHNGTGAVRIAITPVRVVCNNTLNLALNTAKRSFSMIHTGNIRGKVKEAREALFMVHHYMQDLGKELETLQSQKMSERQILEAVDMLIPVDENATVLQQKNVSKLREDLKMRYYEAPDLKDLGNNAYRFINAVSDFATHVQPLRKTANYKENLFMKTVDGNALIDKAYDIIRCAA